MIRYLTDVLLFCFQPKQCTPRVTNNSKRVVREALELCIPEVQVSDAGQQRLWTLNLD